MLLLLHLTANLRFDYPVADVGSNAAVHIWTEIFPMLKRIVHIGPVTLIGVQFIICIYGGYFGGAIGIMMLATWTLFGMKNIHFMNANRTLLGSAMNTVAVTLFIIARKIWWAQTLAMLVASITGGYFGARVARESIRVTSESW